MSFTYSLTRRLLDIAAMPEAAVDHQEPILRAVCEYLEKLIRILRSDEEKRRQRATRWRVHRVSF